MRDIPSTSPAQNSAETGLLPLPMLRMMALDLIFTSSRSGMAGVMSLAGLPSVSEILVLTNPGSLPIKISFFLAAHSERIEAFHNGQTLKLHITSRREALHN